MPPALLLGCQAVSKAYGSRSLFEALSFGLLEGAMNQQRSFDAALRGIDVFEVEPRIHAALQIREACVDALRSRLHEIRQSRLAEIGTHVRHQQAVRAKQSGMSGYHHRLDAELAREY